MLFRSAASGAEETALALIAQGDVERLAGDYAAAAASYSAAQDKCRTRAAKTTAALPERERRNDRPRHEGRRERHGVPPPDPGPAPPAFDPSQAWKTAALREAAYRARIQNLLRRRYVLEAREALADWALASPLSKLHGDYPLAEAEYSLAIGDAARAAKTLRAYREGVELTRALPEALLLELQALLDLARRQEAAELAAEFVKRFPNHPDVERARRIAQGGS